MANGANKKPRIESDAYFTPGKPVRQILHVLRRDVFRGNSGNLRVLEPSCGSGNILTEVLEAGMAHPWGCTGVDIVDVPRGDHLAGCTFVHADFLSWASSQQMQDYDLVIGNPPYGDDMPAKFVEVILDRPWRERPGTVVLLMRLAWLASAKRVELHRRHPPSVYVLSERPSFTKDGKTDGADYAWFMWKNPPHEYRRAPTIEVLGTEDPAQPGLSL